MFRADEQILRVREVDWLMVAVVVLCCLGLVTAVSVGGPRADIGPLLAMKSHGWKLLIGLVAFLLAATAPLSLFRRSAVSLLAVAIMLCLACLLFAAPDGRGARRWIHLGAMTFQPVELARFALILYSAAWIAFVGDGTRQFKTGLVALMGPAALLAACLLMQPDVGNAVFTLTLAGVMAIVGGVRLGYFAIAAVPMLLGLVVLVMNRGYVHERLVGFLEIEQGGQVWQSLVAISSGGLVGRGLGEGWMKMGFVPEANNDFVFAVIGEELGLFGSVLVLGMYAIIAVAGLRLVLRMECPFRRMLVFGFTFAICMQAAINLLVVTGMAPAKGIDLPFLSSGGTNLVFTLGAIGIIGNAARTDGA